MNRKHRFVIITIILSGIIIFCTTQTVLAQSKSNITMDAKQYRKMEQDYVRKVRDYLNEEGYENSGVTLTKVMENDTSKSYTLKIHHKRMEYLDTSQKEQLVSELFQIESGLWEVGISQDFLEVVF